MPPVHDRDVARRRRAVDGIGRRPAKQVKVVGVEIVVEESRQVIGDHRRVGDEEDAAPSPRAVALVVVGQAVGAEILAADDRGAAVDNHVLGVHIPVAVVDVPGRVGDHEPARSTGLLNDPAGMALLIGDAARRPTFQQHRHGHTAPRRRGQLSRKGRIFQHQRRQPDG